MVHFYEIPVIMDLFSRLPTLLLLILGYTYGLKTCILPLLLYLWKYTKYASYLMSKSLGGFCSNYRELLWFLNSHVCTLSKIRLISNRFYIHLLRSKTELILLYFVLDPLSCGHQINFIWLQIDDGYGSFLISLAITTILVSSIQI